MIADIGAGTGVYARELLTAGYEVHALDATPGHVARLRVDPTLDRLRSVTLGTPARCPTRTAVWTRRCCWGRCTT